MPASISPIRVSHLQVIMSLLEKHIICFLHIIAYKWNLGVYPFWTNMGKWGKERKLSQGCSTNHNSFHKDTDGEGGIWLIYYPHLRITSSTKALLRLWAYTCNKSPTAEENLETKVAHGGSWCLTQPCLLFLCSKSVLQVAFLSVIMYSGMYSGP